MMSKNTLSPDIRALVTKAVSECSNDEIALDALAQWAFNLADRNDGYGIEENYVLIKENLTARFNLSDSRASEAVERLREYGARFMVFTADPGQVRDIIYSELESELGEIWSKMIIKRLSKASEETKRVAYLIFYLRQRGFELMTLESVMDQLQAFHTAAFEKSFHVQRKEQELLVIGLLNLLESGKQAAHLVNPLLTLEILRPALHDVKVNTDTRQVIDHHFQKREYEKLLSYDELCRELFGMKSLQTKPDLEKKIVGGYNDFFAVSPFLLEEIRDDLHAVKSRMLDEYELRIDSALLKVIKDSWPDGKVDLMHLESGSSLWRIDNQVDPKTYVLLTPWLSDSDLATFKSKLEVPKVSNVMCVVLSQTPESARELLKESSSEYGQLVLLYPMGQKDSKSEILTGTITPFSNSVINSLSRALKLSISLSDLKKTEKKVARVDVGRSDQFGSKPERAKAQIGMLDAMPVYWSPTRERNWNLGVFGEAGSGKTQLIKKILSQVKPSGVPFVILDSFSEYVSKDNSVREFGTVVSSSDLTVNPLELIETTPSDQLYRVLDTISAVFELSEQQESLLKLAIRGCYEAKGILQDDKKSWLKTPPTLSDLKAELERSEQKEVRELAQKIGPALGIQLYSGGKTNLPFDRLVSGPMVVNLGSLQTSEMKTLATEFILGKIPSAVAKNFEEPQLFVVVDGAPNLFRKGSNSLRLLVEARTRGTGIIYTYRDPTGLPEIAFNCTATILSFEQSESKALKFTSEKLGLEEKVLKKSFTDKFSAAVQFSSMADALKFKASPDSQN